MSRPYRMDGYRPRKRVNIRLEQSTCEALDELARSLALSRAYACDLILGIAVEEGGTWLRNCINRRVKQALDEKRAREWGNCR